jgi:hypothetical protein
MRYVELHPIYDYGRLVVKKLLTLYTLLALSGCGGSASILPAVTTLVSLSASSFSVSEGSASTITLTATLSQIADEAVTVSFSTSGVATSGTDYATLSNITIAAGDTTGTASFSPIDDAIYEGDEGATVAISSVSGGFVKGNRHSVAMTITEDESGPKVALSASSSSISESSNSTITLSATLSQIADEDVTVSFSTSGTATEGIDYTAISNVTIAAGSYTGVTTFTSIDNAVYEADKVATVAIALVSGANATENGRQSVNITVSEYDSSPTVSLAASSSSTSESSSSPITLTATLSQIAEEAVVVSVSTSGTATSGTDYGAISNITIAAGSATGTASFSTIDDVLYEGDEVATVAISTVSGGGATKSGSQSVGITITENETAPTVFLSASASTVYDNAASLTITATASQISDESIMITFSTSGTATEGNDYSTVPDITIPAWATAGTASFNPTADSTYEGTETAVITVATLLGADASLGSPSSVSIAITEDALRLKTNFVEGTSSEQDAIKANVKWTYIDPPGSTSTVHPYEQMNIHKVQSFSDGTNNLTGEGQLIHIADFKCDDDHKVFDNKTIYNLDNGGSGESMFTSPGSTVSLSHCQFVATMAAGDSTGSNLAMGVAPDADLVLSSIENTEGDYNLDDYARDLNSAKSLGATVSNNSWGYSDNEDNLDSVFNVTEAQTYIDNNNLSTNAAFAYLTEGDASSSAQSSSQSYITALNSFQESGVIVFSAGNNSDESDVSFLAGLPEFYPDLAEAWVAVGLIDFTGSNMESATELDFTLYGNKCGSAKEYCVVADGFELTGAGGTGDNTYLSGSGSSFSTPMVSGGIALLAQAFPNHTPEQLTDRLLASANNKWFTAEGETTFTTHGNTVKHGYHSTWGQGVPDFYAALSPILTSSNTSLSMYTGVSIQTSNPQSISSSSLAASPSYGDAITRGLRGESTYAYDALSGGFEVEMSSLVTEAKQAESLINFNQSFSELGLETTPTSNQVQLTKFDRVISESKNGSDQALKVTMGAKTIPIQSFLASNLDPAIDIASFSTPYLNQSSSALSIGAGAIYPIADSRLLLGFTLPVRDSSSNVQNQNTSMTASLESDWNDNLTTTALLSGLNSNASGPLGMDGFGALNMTNAKSATQFIAMKLQSKLTSNMVLTAIATASRSSSSVPSESLVRSSDEIRSSSFVLGATRTNIFGTGALSISVSQPDRVSSGSLNIGIPQLSDVEGNISQSVKSVSLSPSGRQLDYQVVYTDTTFSNSAIRLKYATSRNANHSQDADLVHSGLIAFSSGGLKVGAMLTDQKDLNRFEMRYGSRF